MRLSAAAAGNPVNVNLIVTGARGARGTNATNGLSAYQIALSNGFVGTEAAWLASLQAEDGLPGINGAMLAALNRAALANLPPVHGSIAYLSEGRRKGFFSFDSSNLATQVAADPQQGIYVAPNVDLDGSSGAWVRQWNGIVGYPEWFGAIGNDGAADNRAPLVACNANCPIMDLASLDYYVAGKLNLNLGYRAIQGPFNPDGYTAGNGCRIISTLTSEDVCRVGPAAMPANTDQFLRNVTVKGICFMHVGARTLPAPGAEKEGVAGLRVEYVIDSTITDNYANEPLVGFAYLGVVGSVVERNRIFRSALFGGNDFCIGHLLTGLALAPFGLVGNNASYFGKNWNATIQGDAKATLPSANRVGMWFDGAITDGFNTEPETLGCGIRVTGLGAGDVSAGNGDFYIVHPTVDQYDGVSYEISGIAKTGHVRIIEPYAGCPAAAPYIIRVRDSGGAVTVRGGDLYATSPANQTIGVNIENSTGLVAILETVLHEVGRPVTVINSLNFIMKPRIVNWINTSPAYQAAVALVNSHRGRVEPSIVGKANSFPQGIMTFDAACNNNVFDPSGIDPACLSGGAASKTIINGASIAAPGYYTSAGVAGAAGAGNQVTGITA